MKFNWDPIETNWNLQYQKLLKYKKIHGDCRVLQNSKKHLSLALWIQVQRKKYKKGNLSEEKTRLLEKIGFIWKIHEDSWKNNYQKLVNFNNKFGHCIVFRKNKKEGALGVWVKLQRQAYKKNKLSKEQIRLLKKLKFNFNPSKEKWETQYKKLVHFQKLQGHCNVSHLQNKSLSLWLQVQRNDYKSRRLSKDRIESLEKLGLNWDPWKHRWEMQYKKLLEFKKNNGHCNPTNQNKKDMYSLRNWVWTQRKKYKKGLLSKNKIIKLNKIGFNWT